MKKKKQKIEKEGVIGDFFKRIFRPITDAAYDCSVALNKKFPRKPMSGKRKRVGEAVFYWAILIIPIIQFLLMYVAVNLRSFSFAFQSYKFDTITGQEVVGWVGFANFEKFITEMISDAAMLTRLKNTLIVYAVHLFVGTVLAILFAYYIYKGFMGTQLFRVILFMPSILSSVVLVLIFNYFVGRAVPKLFGIEGLMSTTFEKKFATVIFYNTFMGFGSGMLMYSNAMGRIPESLTEYAKLEGCSATKEFFSITLPLIFPTVETFLIIGLANIFTDQANLFTFFLDDANGEIQTIGYYLFQTIFTERSSMTSYPYASAAGLTLTAITIPIVMTARYFLNKLDKGVEF